MTSAENDSPIGLICRDLNEQQLRAATHADGPLLIVAGAGTGKTATLAHRVAVLIARGVDPGSILLLTFTRRAASEMLRRAEGLLRALAESGGPTRSGATVWGGTFHSAAARLLRMHARDLGMEPDFTILDRADSEDLMHLCRTELVARRRQRQPLPAEVHLPRHLLALRQRAGAARRGARARPSRGADTPRRGSRSSSRRTPTPRSASRCSTTTTCCCSGARCSPTRIAGERVRERFDHVLVDEYQDTNALQADIVALLRPDSTGITAVGDDAQAIYSFRAASVRNILDFEQRHPGDRGRHARRATTARPRRSSSATNAIIAEAERAPRQGPLDRARPTAGDPRSSPAATRPSRPTGSSTASSSIASRARCSSSRPCSSARSTTR